MTQVWTGSFQSSTYPMIYGNLKTTLKPLTEWDYKTIVNIEFTGFASIIQSIFSKYMKVNVLVSKDKKFYTKIGDANVVFSTGNITPTTTLIEGMYEVKKNDYISSGKFYLQIGEGNYEKSNCSIM